MQTITTTQLRTKSKDLVKALDEGKSVNLIHRSKIIGTIKPERKPKIMTESKFKEIEAAIHALHPKKLIPRHKRDEVYRKNLEKKYGSRVS